MRVRKIKKSKLSNPLIIYLIMIILGILSGLSGISYIEKFGLIVSDIFINIFKCISTPIIALSIIVTLSSYDEERLMTNVWRKTILYTILTTIMAATVSCILYLIIRPINVNNIVHESNPSPTNTISYLQHVSKLIPSNILSPFLEQQVIGVLLIGIIVGIAIRYIQDKDNQVIVIKFFKGIHGVFFIITKWVVAILPLGLYGFITTTVIQVKSGMNIEGIGEYLLIIIIANIIQGAIVLPLWLWINKINPIQSLLRMMPALSVAFFSKSSSGTLPVTIDTAEKQLNLDPRISRFVLPLCTTLNMNGCAAFIFTTVIYLMQNHGIEISLAVMGCWIIIATIAAVGNAGVPMGCFLLSASLLSSMNVPIILLGLILPFYNVIDMIETALNVWSDSCVANVVNKKYGNKELIHLTSR